MPSTTFLTASMALLFSFPTLTTAMTDQQMANRYGLTLSEYELHQHMILAHGVILAFAFAFMYPFGATVIRTLSFKGVLWFHAGWQVAAYILSLAGLAIGIWLTIKQHQWKSITGHPILGLIVIGGLLLMPPLGWIHHVVFVKRRGPSAWTYLHRWIGRILIVLGGINGGLGLWMAHTEPFWLVMAYSVCSAFFFAMWFTSATLLEMIRRRKVKSDAAEKEKALEAQNNNARTTTGAAAYGGNSDQSSSEETMVEYEKEVKIKL